jgi:protein-disulfide isomerase
MHQWSRTAAIANECAYQINPSAFVAYRSLIFKNQISITVTSVRDAMLQYGEEAGVDRLRLAACIDSKASLPRIEAGHLEGEKLGVTSTPTSFVNGRILVGAPPAPDFYKIVDEALARRTVSRRQ